VVTARVGDDCEQFGRWRGDLDGSAFLARSDVDDGDAHDVFLLWYAGCPSTGHL
jgi:hypothetical protein